MKIPFSNITSDTADKNFPFPEFNQVILLTAIIQIADNRLNESKLLFFCRIFVKDELFIKAYDLVFGLTDKGPKLPNTLNCAT